MNIRRGIVKRYDTSYVAECRNMAGFEESFRGVRYYPVILLLDVSGSMEGDPINALHSAVTEMVNSFAPQRTREKMIKVAIITFGGDRANLHMPYTDAPDVQAHGVPRFNASGMTPLGSALREAKRIIEDKSITPGKRYQPAIVLVSDGLPTDDWERALHDFIHNGRTSKCIRIGVPIGSGADVDMMETFTGNRAMIFYAQDVSSIADAFKNVVISITQSHEKAKPIEAQPTVKRSVATTLTYSPRLKAGYSSINNVAYINMSYYVSSNGGCPIHFVFYIHFTSLMIDASLIV